ncbi:unnamed protein product [Eruca vesicaria subsp. sativa]|uniref:Myb/SANT-like DNA-binding domain-containing protein n=1 Tax=Eruca vesicaria subsp. sativa TaxID=29727 RepID=A0ABC8KRS9_ERUVS|nr:unnamed protein product [Eruca vesicaria subsp. sativa]
MANDDDEDQILSSSDSPDKSSSPPPEKATVTVASTPPPSSSQQKDLALLPIQSSGGGGGDGRPRGGGWREDCWSERATGVLIDAWGEKYLKLSRGNLKQNHWEEVAETVRRSEEDSGKTPKTHVQCRNRIDTVKKRYKQEKARSGGGGRRSSWVFYNKLDRLIGFSTAKISSLPRMGGKSLNLYHQQDKGMMSRAKSVNVHMVKRKRNVSDSDSEFEDSEDSLPPKKKRKRGGGGNKWRELSSVIMRFSEAYEEIEKEKLKLVVEMEKERLRFLKEMELQRMQFFEKMKLELSQLKQAREENAGNNSDNDVVGD